MRPGDIPRSTQLVSVPYRLPGEAWAWGPKGELACCSAATAGGKAWGPCAPRAPVPVDGSAPCSLWARPAS